MAAPDVPESGFALYVELADFGQRLLRNRSDKAVLATSSVHPRNPLPAEHTRILQAMSQSATAGSGTKPRLIPLLLRWVLCVLVAVWDTAVILHIKVRYAQLLRLTRNRSAAIALKTWCFGPASVPASADFYYGRLPFELARRGVECMLVCGNVQARQQLAFAKKVLQWKEVHAVPELALVPFWAPLLSTLQQLSACLRLRRMAQREANWKFAAFCSQVSIDLTQPATTRNMIHFYIARNLARAWHPKVFVTLYEGQPWEKLAWLGMKTTDPTCTIAGYQHTVVMKHALSLLQPNLGSWEVSTPGLVLCSGEAPRKMMKPSHERTGAPLIVFGSHRRNPSEQHRQPRLQDRKVVVVPEGTLKESKLLFDFAIKVACLVPDHEFVLRCHPILSFEEVRTSLAQDPATLPNVSVSREDIDADFARCSIILYRGSSTALYAILNGLRPVYLHRSEFFAADPLFELRAWRDYVHSEQEFVSLLKRYAATNPKDALAEWRPAWDYVNSYTVPVTTESIDLFLSSVALRNPAASERLA